MNDVNRAVANLGRLAGIAGLELDAHGALSLVFNDETTVNLSRVDDRTIELWTPIGGINASAGGETALRVLLEANYLGEGTGNARLAIAPASGDVVLCERFDVGPASDHEFGDRIVQFLKYAAFWASPEGGRQTLSAGPAPELGNDPFMMRA